jgi:hypothetical protein
MNESITVPGEDAVPRRERSASPPLERASTAVPGSPPERRGPGSPPVSEVQPSDSVSQVGSTASVEGVARRAQLAALRVHRRAVEERLDLEAEELGLSQRRRRLELQERMDIAEAVHRVYQDEETTSVRSDPISRSLSRRYEFPSFGEVMVTASEDAYEVYCKPGLDGSVRSRGWSDVGEPDAASQRSRGPVRSEWWTHADRREGARRGLEGASGEQGSVVPGTHELRTSCSLRDVTSDVGFALPKLGGSAPATPRGERSGSGWRSARERLVNVVAGAPELETMSRQKTWDAAGSDRESLMTSGGRRQQQQRAEYGGVVPRRSREQPVVPDEGEAASRTDLPRDGARERLVNEVAGAPELETMSRQKTWDAAGSDRESFVTSGGRRQQQQRAEYGGAVPRRSREQPVVPDEGEASSQVERPRGGGSERWESFLPGAREHRSHEKGSRGGLGPSEEVERCRGSFVPDFRECRVREEAAAPGVRKGLVRDDACELGQKHGRPSPEVRRASPGRERVSDGACGEAYLPYMREHQMSQRQPTRGERDPMPRPPRRSLPPTPELRQPRVPLSASDDAREPELGRWDLAVGRAIAASQREACSQQLERASWGPADVDEAAQLEAGHASRPWGSVVPGACERGAELGCRSSKKETIRRRELPIPGIRRMSLGPEPKPFEGGYVRVDDEVSLRFPPSSKTREASRVWPVPERWEQLAVKPARRRPELDEEEGSVDARHPERRSPPRIWPSRSHPQDLRRSATHKAWLERDEASLGRPARDPHEYDERVRSTQEHLESLYLQQAQLIGVLQAPKVDLPKFSGEPLEYHPFIRAFEENVEKTLHDDGARLARLIQLCTGEAARVIRCCSLLPSKQGYLKARRLLKERFGDNFVIAELWVDRLTEGGPRADLREFADDLRTCYESLQALGAFEELKSQASLAAIVKKLPTYLQNRWRDVVYELRRAEGRRPDLWDVVLFVEKAADVAADPVYGQPSGRNAKTERSHQKSSYAASAVLECPICLQEGHEVAECAGYLRQEPNERLQLAVQRQLCFVCLQPGHITRNCGRKEKCGASGCGQMHAALLHEADWRKFREGGRGKRKDSPKEASSGESSTRKNDSHVAATSYIDGTKVALPLLPVVVTSPESGISVRTYALLDSGSNVTMCSDELLKALHVEGRPETMTLTTLEKSKSQSIARVVRLTVTSLDGEGEVCLPKVLSRRDLHLTRSSLVTKEEVAQWPHLRDLPLQHAPIDNVTLLVGQDCPEALAPLTTVAGQPGEPYAIRTRLGWTVNGPVSRCDQHHPAAFFTVREALVELQRKVDRFWQLESDGVFEREKGMSVEDRKALVTWQDGVRFQDGHYVLPIPFRTSRPKLPDNRIMALKRLGSLGRKLQRNPELQRQYVSGIQALIDKGYAVPVPPEAENRADGKVWYLPHHPVINPNKDKPRIVFDCAAEHHGTSLNRKVLSGPDLTNKLVGVLTRFRLHPVALMADVEAMFHQVRVCRDDQDVLRFLWWPEGRLGDQPASYRMTVHLFGGTWSPSCCTYALQRTVEDYGRQYSALARETVLRNFYVDDCLKSVTTEQEAVDLVRELKPLLAQGGFNLTKWTTNRPEVLRQIPEADRSPKAKECILGTPAEDRALGVFWRVEADYLGFQVQRMDRPLTKRGILGMLSSVYDPLGVAGPFVLRAKKLVQDMCRAGVAWDDPASEENAQRWGQWVAELSDMAALRVPRCIQPPGAVRRQLHHFADASEIAYGVVTYLRAVDHEGVVSSTIVMAKSRLAPIKAVTIPRLELQAATIAVRQDSMLRRELDMELDDSCYWTDSTIVLQYIRNTTARYHTFVANRIAEIHEGTKVEAWRHVPTRENPADNASRGTTAAELGTQKWLCGPEFLLLPPDQWPSFPGVAPLPADDPEVKTAFAAQIDREHPLERLVDHYSNWGRLLRVIACFMLIPDVMLRGASRVQRLQAQHLQRAEDALWVHVQSQHFADELDRIEGGRSVARHSPLSQLRLGLRGKLLVVTGRLTHAEVPAETKEPIVLPSQHPSIEALIRYTHERTAHAGRGYVLAELRRRYHILGAALLVRKILAACVACRRRAAKPCVQQEADLPEDRVRPCDPAFTSIGVDYFGPFLVTRGRTKEKKYGCLFTCLTTRAVHIEVADSLDTDSFLNCLHRFMARRGEPRLIRSDNGTNFVGAEKELSQEIERWNHERIQDELNDRRIQWLFNPPGASHMGGVWERQIRTVRRVLAGLTHGRALTHEMLNTLLTIAEGLINNRPLTAVSDDPRDLEPLTPNHLLIHRPVAAPPGPFHEADQFSRRKWRQVQFMADEFWRRWTREYLPLLRRHTKWMEPHRNVSVGDLVMVLEHPMPRSKWPVGRIVDVRTGRDGLVRAALVRTADSELLRPVTRICVLEDAVSQG